MPIIKVEDIHHVRLSAPDLDVMERFLVDFGMTRATRTDRALYMRGAGPRAYIHVTELGAPGFIGFAYQARSADDLKHLSQATGAPVETIEEFAGGLRVRLREPNGFQIDVVHDVASADPLPDTIGNVRPPGAPTMRTGAPRILRLAHGVLASPRMEETVSWFRDTLGLITTDELVMGEEERLFGSFNRIDAGSSHVDHHVFFCFQGQKAGMHHASFQVVDVNDIFLGHDHLARSGYEHIRGIGRHALGCQIFDYWVSPFDQMHELWTTTERFTAESGANKVRIGPGMAHDNGPPPSERFVKQATPAPA